MKEVKSYTVSTIEVECECGDIITVEESDFEYDVQKRMIQKIECEYCGAELIVLHPDY